MSNVNIEGPIALTGKGFVARPNGNFQPGEFKRLSNMEQLDETGLVSRRNMYTPYGSSQDILVPTNNNFQRFLGSMGDLTLMVTEDSQFIVGEDVHAEAFNEYIDVGGNQDNNIDAATPVGFFRYNNANHWIVQESKSGVSIGLSILTDGLIPDPDIPATYGPGYEANLTRYPLITFLAGTREYFDFQFRNFFIYKERLWIATSVGLYFSGATMPTDFVPPNGGFFKYPGNTVTWAMAVKDHVYVLCVDAVYSLTYSTDPNLDATMTPLSTSMGGEMGVVHGDMPYFINNIGIYSINGNNVDRVMDSRFDVGKDVYANRIFSFEDYLVVNKYLPINYNSNYTPPSAANIRYNLWPNPISLTDGGGEIMAGWAKQADITAVRRNVVLNPSFRSDFKANSSYYDATTGTVSAWADWYQGGAIPTVKAAKVTRNTSNYTGEVGLNTGFKVVNPDEKIRLFATFGLAAGAAKDKVIEGFVRVMGFDGVDAHIISEKVETLQKAPSMGISNPNGTGALTSILLETTNPGGAGYTNVFFVAGVKNTHGEEIYIRQVFAEIIPSNYSWGSIFEPFDGNATRAGDVNCAWIGTPDNSESTATYLDVVGHPITATVANGLALSGDCLSSSVRAEIPRETGTIFVPRLRWSKTIAYTYGSNNMLTLSVKSRASGSNYVQTPSMIISYLDAADAVLGSTTKALSTSGTRVVISGINAPVGTAKLKFEVEGNLEQFMYSGRETVTFYLDEFHLETSSTYTGFFTGNSPDTVDTNYGWLGAPANSVSTASVGNSHGYLFNNGSYFPPFMEGNSLGYNTYFINTVSGSTHVLEFMDQYGGEETHGGVGYLVDALVNPHKDSSGNYKIWFVTNRYRSGDTQLEYTGHTYFMSSSEDLRAFDYNVDNSHRLRVIRHKLDIEIDSFVPDGNEHKMKKFRNLAVQGVFSRLQEFGVRVLFSIDNSPMFLSADIYDDTTLDSDRRPHFPHRVGINQRGRSLTVRLAIPYWFGTLDGEEAEGLEQIAISDMRVFWSYTQRLATNRSSKQS